MEFNWVHMKYFVPLEISSFIAQISAGMCTLSLMYSTSPAPNSETDKTSLDSQLKLDPEMLMGMAVEEWEHCQPQEVK